MTQRGVPRAVRERQMLDVATRVLAARGYDRTSMDEIAAEVGVTKPMLYAYFGSKEGLMMAAARRSCDELVRRVSAAVAEREKPEEQLWSGLVAFYEFVDEHRDAWRVLFREALAGSGAIADEVSRRRAELIGVVRQLLAEADGMSPAMLAEVDATAHVLVGGVESLANWWIDHGLRHTAEEVAMRVMNLIWLGLADLGAGKAWTTPDA